MYTQELSIWLHLIFPPDRCTFSMEAVTGELRVDERPVCLSSGLAHRWHLVFYFCVYKVGMLMVSCLMRIK